MEKKLFTALAAAVMSVAMSMTALATVDAAALAEENAKTAKVLEKGQWVTEGTNKKYVYADGTFAQDVWKGVDGYVYHFDGNGYMEASKLVKAGEYGTFYYLNELGQLYEVNSSAGLTTMCTYRCDQPVGEYDPRYPLKGMLAEYGLEFAPVVDNSAFSGFYTMDADPANFDKKYHGSNAGVVQEYAYALSGNLADYEAMYKKLTTGRAGFVYPNPSVTEDTYPEVKQVLEEIRNFLNSFDFKNASEKEKAQKVAEYVSRASYDYDTYLSAFKGSGSRYYSDNWRTASIYGCLVDKKCVCMGYSDAFHTLARMVGLLCVTTSNSDHQWDYVRIDGEWWTHSNGEIYRPGATVIAEGRTLPTFEGSYSSFGETNPNHPVNWAYLP